MSNFEYDTAYEKLFTILAVVFLVIAISLPLAFAILIWKNRKDPENEDFEEKFGELYEGIDPNRLGAAFYWNLFVLQRMLQCAICVFL